MEEIEVKVLEIDKEKVVKKLLDLGAEKVFEGDIYALTYDFEDEYLTKSNSLIRLRKKGEKVFLTYKKGISTEGAKIMKELESEVGDFDDMNEMLNELNLKPIKEYKKKRTTYKLGDVLFEIDEYKGIPAYLEIEAPSVDVINKYIDKLGIDKNKVKSWTGKELLEHYNK
jgi:adenylate cyclase class 2